MSLCDDSCSQHADPGTVNKMQLQFCLLLDGTFPTPDDNSDSHRAFVPTHSYITQCLTIFVSQKIVSLQYVKYPLNILITKSSPLLQLRFASG